MKTDEFIKQQCHNAPHLTETVAEFMLNAGVTAVLEELNTAVPGWECDLYGWLVVGDNDQTFVVETNHGGPFRTSITTTLDRLHSYRNSYAAAIAALNTALQASAHVTT